MRNLHPGIQNQWQKNKDWWKRRKREIKMKERGENVSDIFKLIKEKTICKKLKKQIKTCLNLIYFQLFFLKSEFISNLENFSFRKGQRISLKQGKL